MINALMADIPTSSLPRFFLILGESGVGRHTLSVREMTETLDNDDIIVDSPDFEWRSENVVRKGSLSAGWNGKLDRLEIVVESHDGAGYGLPEEALRVLEVSTHFILLLRAWSLLIDMI